MWLNSFVCYYHWEAVGALIFRKCWLVADAFFHEGSLQNRHRQWPLSLAKLFGCKRCKCKFHGKPSGCRSKCATSPVIRWNSPSIKHLVESINDTVLGKGTHTKLGDAKKSAHRGKDTHGMRLASALAARDTQVLRASQADADGVTK